MAESAATPPPARERAPAAPGPAADPLSAMAGRFALPFRWFARRFFSHFGLDEATVLRLRALEERGAVVPRQ